MISVVPRFQWFTPPKSNIDTKNDGFKKCISFQIWLFWVSMLVLGGVLAFIPPFCCGMVFFFWKFQNLLGGNAGLHFGESLFSD